MLAIAKSKIHGISGLWAIEYTFSVIMAATKFDLGLCPNYLLLHHNKNKIYTTNVNGIQLSVEQADSSIHVNE